MQMNNNYQITFTWYDNNWDSKFRIQENNNGKFWPSVSITLSRYELQGLPWDEVVQLIDSHMNQSDFSTSTSETTMETPQTPQGKQLTNLGQKASKIVAKYWQWILWGFFLMWTIPVLISWADERQRLRDEIIRLRQERETKYSQCQNTCMQEREVYDAKVMVLKKKLETK